MTFHLQADKKLFRKHRSRNAAAIEVAALLRGLLGTQANIYARSEGSG
jgi:hypothetical protein